MRSTILATCLFTIVLLSRDSCVTAATRESLTHFLLQLSSEDVIKSNNYRWQFSDIGTHNIANCYIYGTTLLFDWKDIHQDGEIVERNELLPSLNENIFRTTYTISLVIPRIALQPGGGWSLSLGLSGSFDAHLKFDIVFTDIKLNLIVYETDTQKEIRIERRDQFPMPSVTNIGEVDQHVKKTFDEKFETDWKLDFERQLFKELAKVFAKYKDVL